MSGHPPFPTPSDGARTRSDVPHAEDLSTGTEAGRTPEQRRTDAGSTEIEDPGDWTICVVGVGYVGLPLAIAFDDEGFDVVGYDVDRERIEEFQAGEEVIDAVDAETVDDSEVTFTADPSEISAADYVVVTVPTPVDEMQNPDFSCIESAARTVGEHMSQGTTVVLESTVYPGATREVLVPALEAASGYRWGESFNVGYSPERASAGDTTHSLRNVEKIVAGDTDATRASLVGLYERIIDAGLHEAPSMEVAEAAKCAENVQRDLNIALVNELAIIFDRLDLDTHDVLEAAGTKWNFHEYSPGLVGGHCIPVDPFYLAYGAEQAGYSPTLTLKGREINEYMPKHVLDLTLKALNQCGNVLQQSRILVLGLAYKPDISDVRTSAVGDVIAGLEEFDVDVVGHDPHVRDEVIEDTFEVPAQEARSFEGFDGVLLATPHSEFRDLDLGEMADQMNDDPLIMDIEGVLDPVETSRNGFTYRRL